MPISNAHDVTFFFWILVPFLFIIEPSLRWSANLHRIKPHEMSSEARTVIWSFLLFFSNVCLFEPFKMADGVHRHKKRKRGQTEWRETTRTTWRIESSEQVCTLTGKQETRWDTSSINSHQLISCCVWKNVVLRSETSKCSSRKQNIPLFSCLVAVRWRNGDKMAIITAKKRRNKSHTHQFRVGQHFQQSDETNSVL